MIPPDQVDEIFRAVRIEEVIGDFVHLKKRGVNYLGLCPFHNEKTPSFTVSPVKGIYKCFGCGKAGNASGFLMDHLKISYPEALRWLANKYHITIEERVLSEEELLQRSEKESIYAVLSFAAHYYRHLILNDDEGKSVGLSYLRSRGLEDPVMEAFGLGYAPSEKKAFTSHALKNNFKKIFLVKSGLCTIKNQTEITAELSEDQIPEHELFDRFHARVLFPVHDEMGRVLGFGGRTLSNEKNVAKYINSPESPVYHKSDTLYGLYQAKKHIQQHQTAILVEGYMDVISLHQYGLNYAVASSGTSLTEGQARKLHRFAEKVIIAYDGDEAGQKAAERAVPMLLEEGLEVSLVFFPDNEDPDSFAKKNGKDSLRDLIQNKSRDFLNHYLERFRLQPDQGPVEKARFATKMASWLALIHDDIRRQAYVKFLSDQLELSQESILQEILRIRREKFRESLKKRENITSATLPVQENTSQSPPDPSVREHAPFYADEVEILRLLILYGNVLMEEVLQGEKHESRTIQMTLAEYVINTMSFEQLLFNYPLHHHIFSVYFQHLSEKGFPDIQFFLNYPDEEVRNFIVKHVIQENEISPNWKKFGINLPDVYALSEKAIRKSILSLKEKILSQIILSLKKELKNTVVNDQDQLILLHKIQQLENEKIEVNKILKRSGIKFIA